MKIDEPYLLIRKHIDGCPKYKIFGPQGYYPEAFARVEDALCKIASWSGGYITPVTSLQKWSSGGERGYVFHLDFHTVVRTLQLKRPGELRVSFLGLDPTLKAAYTKELDMLCGSAWSFVSDNPHLLLSRGYPRTPYGGADVVWGF